MGWLSNAVSGVTNAVTHPVQTAVGIATNPLGTAANALGIKGTAGTVANTYLNPLWQAQTGINGIQNGVGNLLNMNPGSPAANGGSGGGSGMTPPSDYPAYQTGLNSSGFKAYENQALNPGPSSWLNAAMQGNNLANLNTRENEMKSNAGATAGANAALASGGGLTSGARERVQEAGLNNAGNIAQGLSRNNTMANNELMKTDQSNKLGSMNNLMNMQFQDKSNLNQYNMAAYNAKMQAWAAGKQADATENAANNPPGLLGGGGILGTGIKL